MSVDESQVDIRIRFAWATIGRISISANHKMEFPGVGSVPGLYRISLAAGQGLARRYIGETVDLRRRFRGYQNPGPTQHTNQRIHDLLITGIDRRGSAEVAICTEAIVAVGEAEPVRLNLTLKHQRMLAENAALLMAYHTEDAEIANL